MIDDVKTGRRLKAICDLKNITVHDVQENLHIGAYQSVYAWFRGKALPSLENFYELSKMIQIQMEELIEEKSSMDESKIHYVYCKRVSTQALIYYNVFKDRA